MNRPDALELFRQYNHDRFLLRHALTVEAVMRHFARELGFADEEDFWGVAGLLHDIDFERFPELHCRKAPELLQSAGADPALIRAVVSHGWNLTVEVKPEHVMEKVLYATDELTGLIWAAALVRPSGSLADLELKSVKKKFKTKAFAAGCSREVITAGAELLGWELDALLERAIDAMRLTAPAVEAELRLLIRC